MSFYLVTGGAGFIGSHVVELLLSQGHQVRVLDNLSTGKKEQIPHGVDFFQADIRHLEAIQPAFTGVDGVFHLAALPSVTQSIEDPLVTHQVNADGTMNVFLAAKDAGVKRVVYSASAAAYGNPQSLPSRVTDKPEPLNPYAVQKYLGELYGASFSRLMNLPIISLRYFNAYGPRMADKGAYVNVISIFLQQKAMNKPMTIYGDGSQTRDFIHVKDIARANVAAMASSHLKGGEVLNIGSGTSISVLEVAECLGGEYVFLENPRGKGDPQNSLADIEETKKLIAWEPTVSFKEGMTFFTNSQSVNT